MQVSYVCVFWLYFTYSAHSKNLIAMASNLEAKVLVLQCLVPSLVLRPCSCALQDETDMEPDTTSQDTQDTTRKRHDREHEKGEEVTKQINLNEASSSKKNGKTISI